MPVSHASLHPSPRRGRAGGLRAGCGMRGRAGGTDEGHAECRGHAARPLPRARPAGQPALRPGHCGAERGSGGKAGARRGPAERRRAGPSPAGPATPPLPGPSRPDAALPAPGEFRCRGVGPAGTAPGPWVPAGRGEGAGRAGRVGSGRGGAVARERAVMGAGRGSREGSGGSARPDPELPRGGGRPWGEIAPGVWRTARAPCEGSAGSRGAACPSLRRDLVGLCWDCASGVRESCPRPFSSACVHLSRGRGSTRESRAPRSSPLRGLPIALILCVSSATHDSRN